MVDVETVITMIDDLLEDRTVPKNVRAKMEEIKTGLSDSKKDNEIKIGTSINIMDDVSNDPNLSSFARTKIWNIVSVMETLRARDK